ncbi:hypothetical protein [Oceanibaculum nanhaiense]|uniref:hypothetical protein n=1 Tax=Oceanibaculum nanhaiense TaxID=1909734 RepID=UPI003D26F71C
MSLRIAIGSHPTSDLQRSHAEALAAGVRACGDAAIIVDHGPPPPGVHAYAGWGWRRCQKHRRAGLKLLCMERGYLGDRMCWTSLGWGGLNGNADFCAPQDPGPERYEAHYTPLAPWREAGDYVLIMGQVPGDMSLQGRDLRPWYVQMAREAAEAYGLPVFLRPHPSAVRRNLWKGCGVPEMGGDLDEALAGAHVVVTWNSNSATDAVVAGVPALTMDRGAVAWPVTGHSIGDRIRPDRSAWAHRLAWCQWSLAEIADGTAWRQLRRHLEN